MKAEITFKLTAEYIDPNVNDRNLALVVNDMACYYCSPPDGSNDKHFFLCDWVCWIPQDGDEEIPYHLHCAAKCAAHNAKGDLWHQVDQQEAQALIQ